MGIVECGGRRAWSGFRRAALDRIKRGYRPTLSQDQLTRVSALVGIYKGLHLLFSDSTADDWAATAEQGSAVRSPDPDPGDDRGRHPEDARGSPLCRRGARRPVSGGLLDGLPVVREAFPRTVRLVSSARLRPPVLEALVSADEVAALAEIEGATSHRLLAQERGVEGIGRDEFVHGVPYAAFINAVLRLFETARSPTGSTRRAGHGTRRSR